jgi:large subunit ribosomal protein L29
MAGLKDISDADLVKNINDRERELVTLRFKLSSNQLENTATLKNVRRDLARMKTEVRTREIAQGLNKGSLVARHGVARPSMTAPAGASESATAERGGFLKGIVDRLTGRE